MPTKISPWFTATIASLVLAASYVGCKSTTNVNNSDMLATGDAIKTITGKQAEELYLALKDYGLEELNTFQNLQITAKSIKCSSKSSCILTTRTGNFSKPVKNDSKAAEKIYSLINNEQVTAVDCKQSLTPGRSGYECSYTPNSSQTPSAPESESSKYIDILEADVRPFFEVLSRLPNADTSTSNGLYLNIRRISCTGSSECSITTRKGTNYTDSAQSKTVYDALAHALKISNDTGAIDIGTGNCSQDVTRGLYKCTFSMLSATTEGACVLICESEKNSCVMTNEQRCVESKKYEVFNNRIPRCPHSIEFRAGQNCPN